jgi:hypothetical protein
MTLRHIILSLSLSFARSCTAVRRTKVIGHNYGLLYRDVAFLPKEIYVGDFAKDSPNICIEIKVKQGYVMADDDEGTQKCRYCYFQVILHA